MTVFWKRTAFIIAGLGLWTLLLATFPDCARYLGYFAVGWMISDLSKAIK